MPKTPPKHCVLDELFYMVKTPKKTLVKWPFFVKKCQKTPPKQCVLEELFYMVKNTQKLLHSSMKYSPKIT